MFLRLFEGDNMNIPLSFTASMITGIMSIIGIFFAIGNNITKGDYINPHYTKNKYLVFLH